MRCLRTSPSPDPSYCATYRDHPTIHEPSLTSRLTASGMKVALIERDKFGGTCVNTGCMPTKTLVASAYAAHLARRGADYGIVLDQPVRIDMRKVRSRAATVTAEGGSSCDPPGIPTSLGQST